MRGKAKRIARSALQWYKSAFMTFSQNQLIAMATSLDKSENKVQFYHLHSKRFHIVKRL